MTDPLEDQIAGIDRPRRLDPEFRARLEQMLIEASDPNAALIDVEEDAARWRIDGPREMPPPLRSRVEAALLRRRFQPRLLTTSIAASIVLLLFASTAIVASHRAPTIPKPAAAPPPAPQAPATIPSPTPQKPARKVPGSLHAFGSAAEFLRYVRGEALQLVGPYGVESINLYGGGSDVVSMPPPATGTAPQAPLPAMMAAKAAPGFSTTNIQEEGVDEPDIVKTDGRRLIVLANGRLWTLEVSEARARLAGSLQISNATGVFLAGDRAIILGTQYEAPAAAMRTTHVTQRVWTKVTVIDIARSAAPRLLSSFEVEGAYVGARLAGGVVRLIVQSGALGPPSVPVAGGSAPALRAAEAGNRRAIRISSVGDWVPHYVLARPGRRTTTGHVHDWRVVSRPADRAGLGLLTIMTIDPDDPRPDNALSVVGSGQILYSNLDSLYVTSQRMGDVLAVQQGKAPPDPVTRIHQFDISDPARARYIGSGTVPGFLLNQFSLSEFKGFLRVATTLDLPGMNPAQVSSKSYVTVLAEKAGGLLPVGSVGNLGAGERIYSVRFIGAMGYVVTFRQIDPLFVIDLRRPARPKLRGELKVPGYSGYLHPLEENLLLGVGRDADDTGQAKGLQFSLFDVSDPATPKRLDVHTMGAVGTSEVEQDHHSFLYWEPEHLVAVPASIWNNANQQSRPFVGVVALTVSKAAGFGRPVKITHFGRIDDANAYPSIRRSLVIGGALLTVSEFGVLVSDLQTFADRDWEPLRS